MRRPILASAMLAIAISACCAQTVYPVDRAEILVGSRFDVKVELPGPVAPGEVTLTVNGADHAPLFGKAAEFIAKEDGKDQSALILRDVSLAKPGRYMINIATPGSSREIGWTVYDTPARKARNVVLLIGDGLSLAHRTAARLLSKGIAEGKASASSPWMTCRRWHWLPLPASIRSLPIPRTRPAPMPPVTRRLRARWASMPIAPPIRSTIRASRRSSVWQSGAMEWPWVSSPTPRFRTRRRPRWSCIAAAAEPMIRSFRNILRCSPRC